MQRDIVPLVIACFVALLMTGCAQQAVAPSATFTISRFEFSGNHLVADELLAEMVVSHLGDGRSVSDLDRAAGAILGLYWTTGLGTPGIGMPRRPDAQGVVRFTLSEGEPETEVVEFAAAEAPSTPTEADPASRSEPTTDSVAVGSPPEPAPAIEPDVRLPDPVAAVTDQPVKVDIAEQPSAVPDEAPLAPAEAQRQPDAEDPVPPPITVASLAPALHPTSDTAGADQPLRQPVLPDSPRFDAWRNSTSRVLIDQRARTLFLKARSGAIEIFPVAVGRAVSPTPDGTFQVEVKVENPVWYPTLEAREEARRRARSLPASVPPGAHNPLGPYFIKIFGAIGMHGTNNPRSIGKAATRGCIRLHNDAITHLVSELDKGDEVTITQSL